MKKYVKVHDDSQFVSIFILSTSMDMNIEVTRHYSESDKLIMKFIQGILSLINMFCGGKYVHKYVS